MGCSRSKQKDRLVCEESGFLHEIFQRAELIHPDGLAELAPAHLGYDCPELAVRQWMGEHGLSGGLCEHDLLRYLCQPQFSLEDTDLLRSEQDMTRPLSHYICYTSHNTYMKGGQFAITGGTVSTDTYVKFILAGCRCVELDVYPGCSDDQPVIYHGTKALSGGQLTVLQTLQAIAPVAFEASPFPLILDVESHMDPPSMKAFARIAIEVFGPALLLRPDQPLEQLPSPAQLRGKVLVRSERPEGKEIPAEFDRLIYLDKCQFSGAFEQDQLPASHSPQIEHKLDFSRESGQAQGGCELQQQVAGSIEGLDELALAAGVRQYNARYLNRVYPHKLYISSQNYPPIGYWFLGFQLVALNMQMNEDPMVQLCNAFFKRNNNAGWVLKPDWLTGQQFRPPSKSKLIAMDVECMLAAPGFTLGDGWLRRGKHSKICCRYPFVMVTSYSAGGGGEFDVKICTKRTEASNKSRHPEQLAWHERLMLSVHDPEWALVRIELCSNDLGELYSSAGEMIGIDGLVDKFTDRKIASATVWAPALREGVRSIELRDTFGLHVATLVCSLSSNRSDSILMRATAAPSRLMRATTALLRPSGQAEVQHQDGVYLVVSHRGVRWRKSPVFDDKTWFAGPSMGSQHSGSVVLGLDGLEYLQAASNGLFIPMTTKDKMTQVLVQVEQNETTTAMSATEAQL